MDARRGRDQKKVLGISAALVMAGGLVTGCGSSPPSATHSAAPTSTAAAPTSAPSTTPTVPTTPAPSTQPATTAPATTAPPTTAAAATAPTTSTPPTTTIVGLTLNGVGNTFTAPLSPTTKPYSASCTTLFDPGFSGECVTVAAPSGTIAALVEAPENINGTPPGPVAERDLVYRDVNNTWSLVLRRTPTGTGERSQVYESDIMRDHDPKAVFVQPAQNSQFGDELDVVEASGVVTLYRQLHGGFAYVPAGGGLDTYVPDPTSGYDEASITYKGAAWTIVAASPVSESQAQALTSEPFSDPEAPEPSYSSNNT